MVKIRLRRVGAKKQPSYRVVVADSRSPRDGRFIEVIGFHNPRTEPETITIQEDRALHWLSVGAQPTEAVRRLLRKLGTLGRFERLKQGEPLEALVAEAAEAAQAAPEVSPKTRREDAAFEAEEPVVEAEEPVVEAEEPVIEAEEPVIEAEEPVVEAEDEPSEAEGETEAEAGDEDEEIETAAIEE
jgi:small subunit ribosomal protein S16